MNGFLRKIKIDLGLEGWLRGTGGTGILAEAGQCAPVPMGTATPHGASSSPWVVSTFFMLVQ